MNYKFHGTTRPNDSYSGSLRFIVTHIACFYSVPPGKCRDGNLKYVTTNSFYILLNSRFTIHIVTRRIFSVHSMKINRRRRGMDPLILNLGNRVVTPKPDRSTPGKEAWYQMNRWLNGLESRSGQCLEHEKSLSPTSIRTPDRPARSLVVIAPTLSLLLSTVYYL